MRILAVLLVLLLAAACGGPPPVRTGAEADAAWDAWKADPSEQNYWAWFTANLSVKMPVGREDPPAIERMVRYAEATAEMASRLQNEELAGKAAEAIARIRETGRLDDWEGEVPGVRRRVDEAESKVKALAK
jgi:hypothetical protein